MNEYGQKFKLLVSQAKVEWRTGWNKVFIRLYFLARDYLRILEDRGKNPHEGRLNLSYIGKARK